MYNVSKQDHITYGKLVEIIRQENGPYKTPSAAFNAADMMRRKWRDESNSRVRILIDEQVMGSSGAEHWSNEEYKSLPKCFTCAKILGGDIYPHKFCGNRLFYSQICSDADYFSEMEKIKDEGEMEIDL